MNLLTNMVPSRSAKRHSNRLVGVMDIFALSVAVQFTLYFIVMAKNTGSVQTKNIKLTNILSG